MKRLINKITTLALTINASTSKFNRHDFNILRTIICATLLYASEFLSSFIPAISTWRAESQTSTVDNTRQVPAKYVRMSSGILLSLWSS